MKIGLLAPIEESVPPKKYGGTERIVYNLVEELVELGHQVDLYATSNSVTSANLIPISDQPTRSLLTQNPRLWFDKQIQATYLLIEKLNGSKYDIIHSHIDEPFTLITDKINNPLVTTIHNPVPDFLKIAYKTNKFISISNSQRKLSPKLDYVSTVYNGINIDKYKFNANPKNYLIFLGRVSPDKGIVQAIEIANKTRNKLFIIAKVDSEDKNYYRDVVRPLINNSRITYIGEVNDKKKIDILKYAKALISPIQWDEPFGLVNIEAMACGVPVLSINRGSLPEIFRDAKVGYLENNYKELIVRVSQINKINRLDCRNHVEKYFSSKVMAKNYLKAYKKIIKLK